MYLTTKTENGVRTPKSVRFFSIYVILYWYLIAETHRRKSTLWGPFPSSANSVFGSSGRWRVNNVMGTSSQAVPTKKSEIFSTYADNQLIQVNLNSPESLLPLNSTLPSISTPMVFWMLACSQPRLSSTYQIFFSPSIILRLSEGISIPIAFNTIICPTYFYPCFPSLASQAVK